MSWFWGVAKVRSLPIFEVILVLCLCMPLSGLSHEHLGLLPDEFKMIDCKSVRQSCKHIVSFRSRDFEVPVPVDVWSVGDPAPTDFINPFKLTQSIEDLRFQRNDDENRIGHGWIMLGVELDNGLRYYNTGVGFYAVENQSHIQMVKGESIIRSVLGEIKYKLVDQQFSEEYVVYVNEEQQRNIFTLANNWNVADYRLLERDCVSFMRAAGVSLGLKLSERTFGKNTTPWGAVSEMNRLNSIHTASIAAAKRLKYEKYFETVLGDKTKAWHEKNHEAYNEAIDRAARRIRFKNPGPGSEIPLPAAPLLIQRCVHTGAGVCAAVLDHD